ncbi:hypothetical protein QYE76_010210 [Lolium multiflorum]|uniref:Uncharacterized protein n=1 Tax=Lolium multiflorum TaxID=4521 RepID=A0AAD8X1N1_LOLMU|nr:hypothetical protein QYE76_010210 [Lolium multiflorum]
MLSAVVRSGLRGSGGAVASWARGAVARRVMTGTSWAGRLAAAWARTSFERNLLPPPADAAAGARVLLPGVPVQIASRRLWSFLPAGNAIATTSTEKRAKKSPYRSKAPTTTTSGIFRSSVEGHAAAIELRRCAARAAPRRGRARRRDVMYLRASSDAHAPRLPISPERRRRVALTRGEGHRWRVGKVVSSPPSESRASRLGSKAPSTTTMRPPRPTTTSGTFPPSSGRTRRHDRTREGRSKRGATTRACGFPWSTARPQE